MFSKKRRADFEEDDGYRDFKPRTPKRQRVPPVVQLCKEMMPDIRTIGESVKAFEEDIKFLSDAIVNEYGHEDYFNDALLNTFRAVVLEQPHKQPAIALLTMVVNSGNEVAAKSVINFFFEELQKYCASSVDESYEVASNDTGVWNKIKLVLRFLSILSPIILSDDLLGIYRTLFQLAVNLNRDAGPGNRNALSEAIYTNTLLDLPYLFFYNRSDTNLQSKVEELFSFVEKEYEVKSTDINLLKQFNKNAPYQTTELIHVVLPNVKKALANDMEQLSQLFPDWQHILTEQPSEKHGFNDALNLPPLEQLKPFSAFDRGVGSVDSMWREPRYNFHVYLPNSVGDFETVLPITTYAGQLFKDIIIDIVESLEFNRKEVARQVVTLDLFFKTGIFAEPGVSIAQLAATYEENPLASTYKIEDISIETILELVFKLPDVSQPFAYFYTLLVEICQNSPKAIAPVFGRAFRFFYNNLDNLDLELKLRYLDWFSIQMSNFNFSWKWNEWESDSVRFGSCFYNAKMNFAKNLIRKELRLTSNTLDVEDSLPDEFKKYLDSSYFPREKMLEYYQSLFNADSFQVNPEDIKKNDLYFRQESFPAHEKVRQLLDYVHKQNDVRDVSELDAIIDSIRQEFGSIISNFDQFIIVLLVQVVVQSGSRSLSHANKYIGDLKDDLTHVFSKLEMDDVEKQYIIVEAILRFWNSNSQNGFLVADSFKFAGLVSPLSIFQFSFKEQDGKNYGLVDGTSIESTFRNLSQHLDNHDCFAFVSERLVNIVNQCISDLGLQVDEEINIPDVSANPETNIGTDLPQWDLLWKYETTMGFLKSILRKYVDEYRALEENLRNMVETALSHHAPTKSQMVTWMDELHKI
ncbi:STO1 (YMR125W) [Zygosaccharomyces parabailii]|nr:STO1 (YMR125W) [Zygosaccharomyces parabailii]